MAMASKTLTMVILVSIFMARGHTKGDHGSKSHQNQDAVKQLTVFKKQMFEEGSDVRLWCVDKVTDVKWNEFIYIVWNISMQDRKCFLGLSPNPDDTCKDGKKLYNSSDGVFLFIPKISMEDSGFYSCDLSYKGGSNAVNVSVIVTSLETHQNDTNGQRIAVCKARYKDTAPTLHWEPALNFTFTNTSVQTVDGFFIKESRVHLPDDVTIDNLICVASYPSESGSLRQKSTLNITTPNQETHEIPWAIIGISSGFVCFILVILVVLYVLRRKYISELKMLCCKSTMSPPAEDKPPQPTEVEEVEPYASYIQRVNSIYNSSAELFNA